MITVTINEREIQLDEAVTVLEAARSAGIDIPTLCWHEGLSQYGGCRLCLVEVEKMPRLQTACTLKTTDGMVVRTETEQIADARRAMLEFILTNHPLDCPFCDKAGECELQDLVYRYGGTAGRFAEPKERRPESNVDPILARNMERCISCTRCVRMCDGVQGASAIDMVHRGGHTVMEPFTGGVYDCEYCGNCLTVCPVGSILSRLYKQSFRPWQMERNVRSVCGYCGVGCNFEIQVRDEKVKRVLPKIGMGHNDGLLCSRGRFGYETVDHPDRLTAPLIRKDGELAESSWEEALSLVARRLGEIRDAHGSTALGAVASVRATNEDNYTLQKFCRGVLGTNNIDSTARLGYAGAQRYLEELRGQGVTANVMSGIARAGAVVIAGGDPTRINPILGLRVRAAARAGGRIVTVGPMAGLRSFEPLVLNGSRANDVLAKLTAAVLKRTEPTGELPVLEEKIRAMVPAEVDAASETAAEVLASAESVAFLIGPDLVGRADGHVGLFWMAALSYLISGHLFLLSDRPNEQGVLDAGCEPDMLPGGRPLEIEGFRHRYEESAKITVPDQAGLDLFAMLDEARSGKLKALYVMGENPVFNLPHGARVREALENLEFLVVQDIALGETARMADVVLPALGWGEKDGTFTNLERRLQRVRAAVAREGKADWEILAELSRLMDNDLGFARAEDVFAEMTETSPLYHGLSWDELPDDGALWPYAGEPLRGELRTVRIEAGTEESVSAGPVLGVNRRLHLSGSLTRRSPALGKIAPSAEVRLAPETAERLGVAGGQRVRVRTDLGTAGPATVLVDAWAPEGVVFLDNHFEGAGALDLMDFRRDPITGAPGYGDTAVRLESIEGED